jgi:hypothetical protein
VAEICLSQQIGPICERALACAPIQRNRRCGPFEVVLRFKSAALAEAIEPVFPGAAGGNHHSTVVFLTRRDLDLTALIPSSPSMHHALIAAGKYYGAWWPSERPLFYLFDNRARRGLVWFAADQAPNWELSRPALPLIQALSVDTTWTPTHGGAIGKDGRFLLLVGRSRSGKTTAALACAHAGWDYAGDDHVIADTKSGRVEPLYTSARPRIEGIEAFAELFNGTSSGVTHDNGEIRHELRLARQIPDRIRGGTIAGILLLRRQGSAVPVFAPARRLDAFSAIFKDTMMSLRGWSRVLSVKLADLVGCAPTFFVDTGKNPALLPDALDTLLDRL